MASAQQSPGFILDLGINRAEGVPLQWVIRKWSDAEAEVKQAGGYGIISYAWGKWHDKSQFVLGGVKGNVNPNGYPTFDIGVSTVDSQTGPNMYVPNKGTVKQFPTTYAIPTTAKGISRNIPKETPLSWMFPKVCVTGSDGSFLQPQKEVFTIANIQKALRAMNIRFVWWDWACFPQGWDFDRRQPSTTDPKDTRGLKMGPEFMVHAELEDVQKISMNKMRYIYPLSTVGCLWWHETIWSQGVKSAPVGDVELIVQQLMTIKDTKNLTPKNVGDLIDALTRATRTESSLSSLWSFQEVVLLTAPARPRAAAPITKPLSLESPSVILDKEATSFVADAKDGSTRAFIQNGQLNMEDIVNVATLIANVMGSSLVKYSTSGSAKLANQSTLMDWCLDPINDHLARGLLSQLINTGFVGLRYNSPLPLLEARFGRDSKRSSAMDASVNTLMGALCVDLSEAQAAWTQEVKTQNAALLALPVPTKLDSTQTKAIELRTMKAGFVAGLFKVYQWRMLLFARGFPARTTPAVNGAAAVPVAPAPEDGTIWQQLVGTKRPNIAALGPYFDPDANLTLSYGPDVKPGAARHTSIFALPLLSITDLGLLRCTLTKEYTICDTMKIVAPAPAWKECVFYQYVTTGYSWLPSIAFPKTQLLANGTIAAIDPKDAPLFNPAGTVSALSVPFGNRNVSLGPNLILIPYQKDIVEPPVAVRTFDKDAVTGGKWVRCFVMSREDAKTPDVLTYKGVADVLGLVETAFEAKVFTIG